MTISLTLGDYLMRVAVPVAGVLGSVILLGAAAVAVILDAGSEDVRQGLFAAGVLSWMFGVGWGVIVNGKPLPPSTRG